RKVRKGTRSCWECRRRKVRCGYTSPHDPLCTPCKTRGTKCHSQAFVNEKEASHLSDGRERLAQRLQRLEDLMDNLVDRLIPDTNVASEACSLHNDGQGHKTPTGSSTAEEDFNLAEPLNLLSGSGPAAMLIGNTTQTTAELAPSKTTEASKILHSLFPSQHVINTITGASAGPYFVTGLFCSHADILENKSESPSAISIVPPVHSHPTVLAKRLLQLAICMQQLSPSFDTQSLSLSTTISQTMSRIVTSVAELVISNDELICCLDGLLCLVLHGYWQSNAGNLRKAWLTFRRALSFGQLIGIDGGGLDSLTSTNIRLDSNWRPSPHVLWYRMISCDRSLSLLLGLPLGCQDNNFASEAATNKDNALEKLEKLHAVVAAKIINRNCSKNMDDFPLTQAIDLDLETGARYLGNSWWHEPVIDIAGNPSEVMQEIHHLILQIQHHTILILLHLPYLVRNKPESRYMHSRETGLHSSRAVLRRFSVFRSIIDSAYSCRHVDYAALMAAMTLLISYLGPQSSSPTSPNQLEEDRRLVLTVKERMETIFSLNHDRLSQESSSILRRLIAILDTAETANTGPSSSVAGSPEILRLSIPYFGTISIDNGSLEDSPAATNQTGSSSADGRQLGSVQDAPVSSKELRPKLFSEADEMTHSIDEDTVLWQYQEGLPPIQFHPQGPLADFTVPNLTANADDWALQGVDAMYWSLLYDGLYL
ncbi:hypothetical protein EDB80DRAFT_838335, partial [Ilyonectria destructans]